MINEEFTVPIISGRGWAGLPEPSKILYNDRYFQPKEDYEVWLDRVTRPNCDDREHRGRMKQYIRNNWFHPATPVSSNSGLPDQGYPVSCFVQSVGDSKEDIINTWVEGFYLGARGAGIGRYWGNVRSAGEKVGTKGKSSGITPFLKVDEALTLAVSQGGLRRASEAAFVPVWHPEIEEFVYLKDPTGDPYRRAQQLFNGVIIDNKFMKAVVYKTGYGLISPKTGEVIKTVNAFDVWTSILEMRMKRGVPYIIFIDNVNDALPEEYIKEQFDVETSNLCVEIMLHTRPDYSAVCVLSSINLEYWEEFSATPELFYQFMEDCHRYLDNVLENFIQSASGEEGTEKAVRSAKFERSIGLGTMGQHSLFQSKGIPFDSLAARQLTSHIYSKIKEALDKSNKKLALEKGASPIAKKHGIMKRNTHVTAIAPTASISTLCGMTSQGIDPFVSNSYTHKTNVGTFNVRNKFLERTLEEMGKNTEEVWSSIRDNDGSVQHLDFLPQNVKDVFKTAYEIKQEAIIELAAVRAPYVDQSQSLNLFLRPPTSTQYLYDLHMFAWAKGVKSLYYVRSDSQDKVGSLSAKSVNEALKKPEEIVQEFEECIWCG